MAGYRIGDMAQLVNTSIDTLRYYEKIGLLPNINRNSSGTRIYNDQDVSHLRFIQRAQKMNFSLAEIADLLKMREDPQHARDDMRQLTANKLVEVEARLAEIQTLRNELQLLLNLCQGAEAGCPIIETMDQNNKSRKRKKQSA